MLHGCCIAYGGRGSGLKSGRPTPGMGSGFGSGPSAQRAIAEDCLSCKDVAWG
jgi:hypothetical protein